MTTTLKWSFSKLLPVLEVELALEVEAERGWFEGMVMDFFIFVEQNVFFLLSNEKCSAGQSTAIISYLLFTSAFFSCHTMQQQVFGFNKERDNKMSPSERLGQPELS